MALIVWIAKCKINGIYIGQTKGYINIGLKDTNIL